MKKLLAISLVVVMVLVLIPNLYAGDKEWATAGKILTGVAVYNALSGNSGVFGRGYYSEPPRVVERHYYHPYYHYYDTSVPRRRSYYRTVDYYPSYYESGEVIETYEVIE